MPVVVTVAQVGSVELACEIRAAVEHALVDYEGDWRVSVTGSQAKDRWKLRVEGPKLFECSYNLEGTTGDHRPEVVRVMLGRMLLKRSA